MSRRIRVFNTQSDDRTPVKLDGYFDRVIKYIPSDVVGAWVAVTGIVKGGANAAEMERVLWIAFVFATMFTAAWTWRQTSEDGRSPAYLQIALSTVAFVVWAVALNGTELLGSYGWKAYHGSLLLIAFTLATGLAKPRQ